MWLNSFKQCYKGLCLKHPTSISFGWELSGASLGIPTFIPVFSHSTYLWAGIVWAPPQELPTFTCLFPIFYSLSDFLLKSIILSYVSSMKKNTIPLSNLDGIGVKDGGKITFNGMKEQSANLKDKLSQIANKQNIENTGSLLGNDIISDHLHLQRLIFRQLWLARSIWM